MCVYGYRPVTALFEKVERSNCEKKGQASSSVLPHLVCSMDPQHYTRFDGTRQPISTNTTLATLLHRADQLSTAFNHHHGASFSNVQAIQSAANQLQNLMSLPSTPVTRSRPEGGIRERGMVKVRPRRAQMDIVAQDPQLIRLRALVVGPRSYRRMPRSRAGRFGQDGT